ncbi:chemotaxis protein CheB [Geoanaerobacter pelophilus]|uniref:Protein-glutamate methylesterase/protein-glutamine glutaminase n=1 Tax=Geoanaerobacter pelophilus TaxID=60036 RepID=A0ABQ0MHB7_9BACT|nr:chemotaxis protein CheB [Geoanaerobacter pelophilus]GAW66490.1 chemotaxis protein CheB [Geoanaerobacter pelophilus]
MIRLLVVEDSKTVQKALVAAFEADPELQVVGVAESGEEAVEAAANLKPDLITMDLHLSGMNGLEATRAIMSSSPVPIVIVSGKIDTGDSDLLFRFMEAGVLMVLPKPAPVGTPGYRESVASLIHHIKLMSEIKVIAIGASTGGPPLLRQILASLPEKLGAAVLVVQHMAVGFTENFVHWLNHHSRMPVRLAADGMVITAGEVYVAPDGCHMEATPAGRISLSCAPPENGVRPSVDALFRSVAQSYGSSAAGIILSGMGKDGAAELKTLKERGGLCIAQDRESSLVFGMPGEAIKIDAVQHVLSPEGIINLLAAVTKKGAQEASK